jgi:hypothetical protein
MKPFKVICQIPLVAVLEQVTHRTGMVTITCGGVVLEPLIIVKSLEAVQCAEGQKLEAMRMVLVERFLDGLQRSATRGKIKSGFRMSDV